MGMVVAASLLITATEASAQPAAASFFELSTGAWWLGPMGFSTPDAFEVGRTGDESPLFSAESGVDGSFGVGIVAAFRLNTRWQVETGAIYARPSLSVHLHEDAEDADDVTAEESLHRIQVDAGIVVRLGSDDRRNQPFVTAGASYLRELHEGQTLAANGQGMYAGGGFRRVLKATPGAFIDTMGLRFDARILVRGGGVNLDGGTHVTAAGAAALFLGF